MAPWVFVLGVAIYVLCWFLLKRSVFIFGNSYYNKATHLIVITDGSSNQLEWLIRSYYSTNRIRGKVGRISCLLTSTKPETDKLLEKMTRRYNELTIVRILDQEDEIEHWIGINRKDKERLVVMDLRELNDHPGRKSTA